MGGPQAKLLVSDDRTKENKGDRAFGDQEPANCKGLERISLIKQDGESTEKEGDAVSQAATYH